MTETFHAGPNLGRLSDVTIIHGDCIEAMAELAADSVDAIVTDPPYGLGFMGKAWDELPPGLDWAKQCLRVLKPGGHLLAFGGMRTQHRLIVAIEDAGFEIRDAISWIFGSGFPKSHNVSDALDRIVPLDARCVCARRSSQTTPDSPAGCLSLRDSDGEQLRNASGGDPESAPSRADVLAHSHDGQRSDAPASESASTSLDGEIDHHANASSRGQASHPSEVDRPSASAQSGTQTSTLDAPASAPRRTAAHTQHTDGSAFDSARYQHMACATCGGIDMPQGLGTALKPATEIICVARKPFRGTVAANVLAHGTAALNIDACRIEASDPAAYAAKGASVVGLDSNRNGAAYGEWAGKRTDSTSPQGRWPANVVLDADQAAALDKQSGNRPGQIDRKKQASSRGLYQGGMSHGDTRAPATITDTGGASRFFHVAQCDLRDCLTCINAPCCGEFFDGEDFARCDCAEHGAPIDATSTRFRYCAKAPKKERPVTDDGISHATVKPLALMRWLVRLVTPPGGVVLDPFAGSGTTVEAALLEDFRVVGIERETDYLPLIQQRIARSVGV